MTFLQHSQNPQQTLRPKSAHSAGITSPLTHYFHSSANLPAAINALQRSWPCLIPVKKHNLPKAGLQAALYPAPSAPQSFQSKDLHCSHISGPASAVNSQFLPLPQFPSFAQTCHWTSGTASLTSEAGLPACSATEPDLKLQPTPSFKASVRNETTEATKHLDKVTQTLWCIPKLLPFASTTRVLLSCEPTCMLQHSAKRQTKNPLYITRWWCWCVATSYF